MNKKNLHENEIDEALNLGEVCTKCGSGRTVTDRSRFMFGYDASTQCIQNVRVLECTCLQCRTKFQVRYNA
jgi:hypothetical protein